MNPIDYYRESIKKENPLAVENDLQMILSAKRLSSDEDGWDALQNGCQTEAARRQIHLIEMQKYRHAEYRCGMS